VSHKLTRRQLQSFKKSAQRQEQAARLKDLRRTQTDDRRDRPPPRRRDWSDDDDYETVEKIRLAQRLSTNEAAAPQDASSSDAVTLTGTVIEVRGGDSLVQVEGRVVSASLASQLRTATGGRSPIAVGDRVEVEPAGGQARIVAVHARRSALTRPVFDPSKRSDAHRSQVIAANVDQVVAVCSPAAPPFRPRLVDRYLVRAALDALPLVVCLNKLDLGVPPQVERYLDRYAALGVAVVRTSALSGEGIAPLGDRLAGGVSVFSGHSGVGKTSLLNALEPGLGLKVGAVTQSRAGQGKGRHTTRSARLASLSLPETFVVDSPGIRALGLRGLTPAGVAAGFPDIAGPAAECAFADCEHSRPEGCALFAAAANDWFLRERLQSYRDLLKEVG
jgi:ribosome biogenesis GTPase